MDNCRRHLPTSKTSPSLSLSKPLHGHKAVVHPPLLKHLKVLSIFEQFQHLEDFSYFYYFFCSTSPRSVVTSSPMVALTQKSFHWNKDIKVREFIRIDKETHQAVHLG